MDTPFLAQAVWGKNVVNREKSSYLPIHNFFCSIFVYLLKKLKVCYLLQNLRGGQLLLLAHKSYQAKLVSQVQLGTKILFVAIIAANKCHQLFQLASSYYNVFRNINISKIHLRNQSSSFPISTFFLHRECTFLILNP